VSRIAAINGVHRSPEEAKVSVYDRGFLYGDSVFDTIRTYGGEPFALDEHLARLALSAEKVAITLPVDLATFCHEVRQAIRAAENPESYARIILTRGEGPLGLDPALAREPLRVILVEPLTPLPGAVYRDGVKVVTVRTERAADAAPGAKVGNYLGGMLALKQARAAGAHEALIVNARGAIVEGATSNFFLLHGGALVTPPEEAGILAGITRAHVLEIAAELGLDVKLDPIFPVDLDRAAEAFLTSSLREIIPVVKIDERTIGDGRPGPLTRRVHAAFRARVGLGDKPMPWE
jgi:branched-chain amino acid aminotransferase